MLSIKEKQRKEIYKEKKGKEIMKDCLTRQERQMLSKALFCSEECDVADFIRIIDHRLKDRKEQYDAFMKQFKDGVVNYRELRKVLDKTRELQALKVLCAIAYSKQLDEIEEMLKEFGHILSDCFPEEEEE